MDLKTLFWEAVQAYILCNSLLKGAISADGWLTGPASSDVNGAKCYDTLWGPMAQAAYRVAPLLRTLGQGTLTGRCARCRFLAL